MEADEFSYTVPGWLWAKSPASVLRNARVKARRTRMRADGDPEVHVVLVWPQEQPAGLLELPMRVRRPRRTRPAARAGRARPVNV